MTTDNSKQEYQFSLRTLMVIITVACVVLAMPGGYILLLAGIAWMLQSAVILKFRLFFRAPIYRLLSGARPPEFDQEL